MRSLASTLLVLAGSVTAQQGKLDNDLPAGEQLLPVFVRMADQIVKTGPDYDAYLKEHAKIKRRAHRKVVIDRLRQASRKSWHKVGKTVKEQGAAIQGVKRYWVVNGFACRATGDACRALAKLDAVAFVYRQPGGVIPLFERPAHRFAQQRQAQQDKRFTNEALAALEKAKTKEFPALDELSPTWNVKRIGAVNAWQSGAFGQGVTIALTDTGLVNTPALFEALWHNEKETLNGEDDDGNGYVDDLFGYDFGARRGISIGDMRGHGSMCGGIMAGRPVELDGKLIVTGIAPKSRLMVIKGMGFLESYEYALLNGADIVSMSYMWVNRRLGNWRGLYRLAHEHMTLAGLVSVGGSGNFGPGSRRKAPDGKQIAIPKDIPCVICASGLDKQNKMPGFSSLGPCTWDGVKFYDDFPADQPLDKPDVTAFITGYPVWAPGQRFRRNYRVLHRFPNASLVVGPQGNSFSGPHAGAVAALMLSANPDLPAWRVKELMESTCKDLGAKGRDHKFGAGMIQAGKAVAAARTAN